MNLTIRLLTPILLSSVCTASLAMAQSGGATCIVTTTLDSSAASPPIPDSLRDCMERARAGDTITFDSTVFDLTNSDATTVINVLQPLPALDDGNVTLDASDRRVTVNGSGAGSSVGIDISSSGNRVMGLSIVGFAQSGIRINDATSNTIGGPRSTGVGPNGQGLRISACGSFGIEISGSGSSGNVVKGCWIGLDASGEASSPNLAGVAVQGGGHDNTIGSPIAGEANVISGNMFEGITVAGSGTDDNVIIGNVIGAGAIDDPVLGRTSVGNGSAGVFLSQGTKNSTVGGTSSGDSNLVANNGGNGIEVRASETKHNAARGNRITKNSSGGIKLFDGSNDGIRPPTITRVQNLGASTSGTGLTLRIDGTTPQDGSVEVFSDSGAQGGTFLTRKDALTGAWTTDVDVSSVQNVSVTLTDALGNTSQFSVFGLTSVDTDDDGVSDVLETLAGTAPDDPADTAALGEPLILKKLQIKLNFAKPSSDSLKMMTNVTLPSGFTIGGSTVGVYVAGHHEQFTLDENGKASSELGSISLKTTKTGPVLKYGIKLAPLNGGLESSGLTNKTTTEDESWVLPVAVTLGSSVSFSTVTVEYKATQGKSGKAKK